MRKYRDYLRYKCDRCDSTKAELLATTNKSVIRKIRARCDDCGFRVYKLIVKKEVPELKVIKGGKL